MFEDTNFNEINGKLVEEVIRANRKIGRIQATIGFASFLGGIGAGHIVAKRYKDKKKKSKNKNQFQR